MVTTGSLSRFRFSMRRLLMVVTVAAVAAYFLRAPVVNAKIEWVGHGPVSKAGGVEAVFRVTNNSPNALWYWAYSAEFPCGRSEAQANGGWEDVAIPGCGVGISCYKLRSGESRICREFYYGPPSKIRLGLDLSGYESMDDAVTVWSVPVDPQQLPLVQIDDDAT